MSKEERIPRRHDLDALRAFAMLLGIVLHAALVYIPPQGAWLVQDVERHAGFGWFISAVHGFRMPLFFLVSGFFTAMLWRKRGVRALLWHRFRRIVLPLALGMVTIIPAMWGAKIYIVGNLPKVDAKENIWAAARAGDVDAIRGHLANGAQLEQRDDQLTVTALSTASITGQLEAVRALLEQGADANTLNGDGGTALHGAAFFGHDEIAKLLLDHGADVNIKNRHGETPLDTTRHDWGVVEYIARIVQYNPDREHVTQGREIVVELIKANPTWQPPAPETSLTKKADGENERPPASLLPFIRWAMDARVFDHLWFLWFLCWLVVAFCAYAKIVDWLKWNGPPAWFLLPPVCFLWLIPLTLLPQWFMSRFGPDTSTGLLPFPRVILYYMIFFGFGALYFDCKDEAGRLGRGWWILLPIGLLVLFPVGYELSYGDFGIREQVVDALGISPDSDVVKAAATFVQVLYVWTMTFGMMGLFRRLFRRENRTTRYLSDASYWLYLTHLPVLFFVQFWLTGVRMPAIIKCTIACAVVVGFLLVLYQLVVRYTWLVRLLNGPRTRPQAAEEVVELAPAEA